MVHFIMYRMIISLISLICVTVCANVTQTRLPNIQSGVVAVYENNSTTIATNSETSYRITYSRSHPTPPTPFYFISRYKMKDKFVYQNLYTYVKSADNDNWQLTVHPVSTTSVLALSVSYIAVLNIYQNFFVKQYTYGIQVSFFLYSQAGLGSGTGNRSYTTIYNFSNQFIGRTLSGNVSQNKLISSWVGFWRSSSLSTIADMFINSYFTNTSFYSISISTSTNSGDWWNRTNVMVCIINMQKFPSIVRLSSGSVVLSPSNTITSWTEFQKFANVSYCFGYTGINTNANQIQDMYWSENNNTAIKAHLSFLYFGRFSYLILWNETVVAEPITPVTPVDPTNPNNNSNNNNNNNTNPIVPVDPIAPVDPVDPNPNPKPNPNPNTNSTDNQNNLTKLNHKQQTSSFPIGIVIGVVIGVIVLGAIVVFLVYRFRHKKGNRVPIPQNLKEFQIFTPSFV